MAPAQPFPGSGHRRRSPARAQCCSGVSTTAPSRLVSPRRARSASGRRSARAIGVATPDAALAAAAHYAFAEHLAAEGCADARDLSAGGRTALLEELVGLVEDGGCKLGLHF